MDSKIVIMNDLFRALNVDDIYEIRNCLMFIHFLCFNCIIKLNFVFSHQIEENKNV